MSASGSGRKSSQKASQKAPKLERRGSGPEKRRLSSTNAVWKVDSEEKAVYIDVEETERGDGDEEYSQWDSLPDLVMEKIFAHLTIQERYYASMVCRSWNRTFYFSRVWSCFILDDHTLTRRKFNYYTGWQKVLDHFRAQTCLFKVGKNFRSLVFTPMWNFFNLYEFMNIMSYCVERQEAGLLVRHLKYTFSCSMAQRKEELVFGTGGKLLEALKRLMGNLPHLRHLELNDLLLDAYEAMHLLDEVCCVCCETLHTLTLINVTKNHFQLLHPGVFVNLQVLMISPQSLGDDLIHLLGCSSLRNLHILQNSYTECAVPVSRKAWQECRENNPRLRVHLCSEGKIHREVIWQERAPVRSIIYDSVHTRITTQSVITVTEMYKGDLEVYAHKGLPRFHMPKSFHDRIDSTLVMLCRQCPFIHTLMVREKISTATVLLIAYTASNLHYFYVRRNAIILRADWPRSPEWSESFYSWLCNSSRSYETMEKEVSQILGYPWNTLTDKQYKMTQLNLHVSPW